MNISTVQNTGSKSDCNGSHKEIASMIQLFVREISRYSLVYRIRYRKSQIKFDYCFPIVCTQFRLFCVELLFLCISTRKILKKCSECLKFTAIFCACILCLSSIFYSLIKFEISQSLSVQHQEQSARE